MEPSIAKKTLSLIKKYNIKAAKNLGQNFLINEEVINSILDKANLCDNDVIIEIGPGLGALSEAILKKGCQLYAFEIDKNLETPLKEELKEYLLFNLFIMDFLKLDLEEFINKFENKDITIISNLPYYITSKIMNKIILNNIKIKKIIVMMQKEVSIKFLNEGSNQEKTPLTFLSQYYYHVTKIIDVPSTCFIPSPNIESTVLLFNYHLPTDKAKNEILLSEVIKGLLLNRRKTILNNLKNYLHDNEKALKVLIDLKIDEKVRAEDLSLNDFIAICNYLY